MYKGGRIMPENTYEVLKNILIKTMADSSIVTENIGIDQDLSDIGLNSITFIKAIVGIEKAFGIEFDEGNLDFQKFKTIGDIVRYVESKI
jgi:acyl carrier protein